MISSDLSIDQLRAAEKAEQESCAQMDAFCREHQLFNVDGTRVKQLCPQFGLVFPRDGKVMLDMWRSGRLVVRDQDGRQVYVHADRVMHAA